MGIGVLSSASAVFMVAALGILLWVSPAAYGYFLMEDSPLEWLDFYMLAAAAGAFVTGARSRWFTSRSGSVACIGLALFCLFVAGEEISWGQRILRFGPPDFFEYRNVQRELTIHNLEMGWMRPKTAAMAFMLGYGIVLPLGGRGLARRWGIPIPPLGGAFAFGIAAFLFANPVTQTDDEVGETVFALAMLCAGLEAWGRPERRRLMLQLLLLLLPLATLTSWASYQSPEERDHVRFVGPLQAGQAYEGVGRLGEAAGQYEKLARYWGSDWELWVKVVALYRDAGAYQKAYDLAVELTRIHRRESRLWSALVELADSLAIRDDAMARIGEQYDMVMRETASTHHDEKDRAFLVELARVHGVAAPAKDSR